MACTRRDYPDTLPVRFPTVLVREVRSRNKAVQSLGPWRDMPRRCRHEALRRLGDPGRVAHDEVQHAVHRLLDLDLTVAFFQAAEVASRYST